MNIDLCKKPTLSIIHGLKGSGKTYLCKFLIYNESLKGHFDYIILFSTTSYQYPELPNSCKKVFSMEYLNKILQMHTKNKKLKGLLIFNDCLGTVSFIHKDFINFTVTHRHHNISVITLSQTIKGLSKTYLMNADHVFLFRFTNLDNMKTIYEYYFSECFPTFNLFKEYFIKQFNQRYKFLHVNMNEYESSKKMHTLRCNKLPQFKLKF